MAPRRQADLGVESVNGTLGPQVPIRHELTDGDTMLNACLSGCGLARFPTWLASDAMSTGALTQVLHDISGGSMPIHVIWQKTWHLQLKVRVTVDALVNHAVSRPDIFNAKSTEL
jgi:DNA-binding transcriptional LysR family regulator